MVFSLLSDPPLRDEIRFFSIYLYHFDSLRVNLFLILYYAIVRWSGHTCALYCWGSCLFFILLSVLCVYTVIILLLLVDFLDNSFSFLFLFFGTCIWIYYIGSGWVSYLFLAHMEAQISQRFKLIFYLCNNNGASPSSRRYKLYVNGVVLRSVYSVLNIG